MTSFRPFSALLFLASILAGQASAQQLVHYWNFNNPASQSTLLTPSVAAVPGAPITHAAGGTSAIDVAGGTGQNFNIGNFNARNSDVSGNHLRFNDPVGGALVFALPTTGFRNAVVKFTTRRSGAGAGIQYWSYSTDGTNYLPLDTVLPVDGNPVLETLDLTPFSGTDNNVNLKLKVTFAPGGGGVTGNNRFDNFTLDASPLPALALVHYWNFNNNASQAALLTPTVSVVTGAAITHVAGGISAIDAPGGTAQNFNLSNFNARNSDVSGTHLRFNDPIGGQLIFSLPITGYEDPTVKFATRRSGSGAGIQYWFYSIDGTVYLPLDTVLPFDGNPVLETLDLTAIAAADDNPNLKLKVTFAQGAGGTVGNNRFDNFTLDAYPVGGDMVPPLAAFNPVNLAQIIAVNTTPSITFNEPVRLINNSPITAANAAGLVQLRINNGQGAMIPFTTTYTANTITIIPNAPLLNNQQYYVALLGNTVEDLSNNAIINTDSAKFKTIPVQTQFAPGDLVFVAYRMNALAVEDEIAFLTLVDILPGTFVNLTDAKYTSNTPPQCPGGITWTAPTNECITAGTVIKIETSTLVANKGTVTGAGFGLSSGGDQVIVYTGTNTSPNYITALSANNWVAANTDCGGSVSKIPAGLSDGVNAANLSTAPGNTAGNSVNAYYDGIQAGTGAQLRAAILNPANWVVAASGTLPQVWPAYSFPGPPTITTAKILTNTTVRLIFNTALDEATASNISSYNGISGLQSAIVTANGSLKDTVVLTYGTAFTNNTNYSLVITSIKDTAGVQMVCPYTYTFAYSAKVSFASNFIVTDEGAGAVKVVLNLEFPTVGSVDIVEFGTPYSTAGGGGDFSFIGHTVHFNGTTASDTISIPVTNDVAPEQAAEYFVLGLKNPVSYTIAGDTLVTVYIKDNDRPAPVPNKRVALQYIGSFDPSGDSTSTCEVVVYDSASKRLFTSSAISGFLDCRLFKSCCAHAYQIRRHQSLRRHYECSREEWHCRHSQSRFK